MDVLMISRHRMLLGIREASTQLDLTIEEWLLYPGILFNFCTIEMYMFNGMFTLSLALL